MRTRETAGLREGAGLGAGDVRATARSHRCDAAEGGVARQSAVEGNSPVSRSKVVEDVRFCGIEAPEQPADRGVRRGVIEQQLMTDVQEERADSQPGLDGSPSDTQQSIDGRV